MVGTVVKNLPASAGYTDVTPGPGSKIPHAVGQLRPCSATRDPAQREACAARAPCAAGKRVRAAAEASVARKASKQQK